MIRLPTAFCLLAASTTFALLPVSIEKSATSGLSLKLASAQARVGRPLTPMSGAGVARRTARRGAVVVAPGAAVRRCGIVNGVRVCR